MNEFENRYKEWLGIHFNKGKFGFIFDRLSNEGKWEVFKFAADLIINETPPEEDQEFMNRVGDQMKRVLAKVEK